VVVKSVLANKSVVGIPGRVVQIEPREVDNPYGINLHHHLIPDPVGKAVSCLIKRLHELESELLVIKQERECEIPGKSCIGEEICGKENAVADSGFGDSMNVKHIRR
jgi:serine O-acetyltransferase